MDPRFLAKRRSYPYLIVRALTRGRFFVITSLALFSLSLGQAVHAHSSPSAQAQTAVIHLVGVVPAKLEMNFTFATGNVVDLLGHGESGSGGFEVSDGRTQGLGFMNVKSNLLQGYTITAFSENGGSMKNLSRSVSVPYSLKIDDRLVESRNGVFQTDFMGKTGREGDMKSVAVQFGDVSDDAQGQVLVDRLTFSIAAN